MDQMRDRERFTMAMAALDAAFTMPASAKRLAVYQQSLADLRIEAIEYGVEQLIRVEVRFPPPAKVREYANTWRCPVVADLSVPAIPERRTVSREALQEAADLCNRLFGTRFGVVNGRFEGGVAGR